MSRQVYAFRVFGDPGEPWYGNRAALPAGDYETEICAFEPEANPSPFSGRTLEMLHGQLPDDDGSLPPFWVFTTVEVDGRAQRVRVRSDVAAVLFPGRSP